MTLLILNFGVWAYQFYSYMIGEENFYLTIKNACLTGSVILFIESVLVLIGNKNQPQMEIISPLFASSLIVLLFVEVVSFLKRNEIREAMEKKKMGMEIMLTLTGKSNQKK